MARPKPQRGVIVADGEILETHPVVDQTVFEISVAAVGPEFDDPRVLAHGTAIAAVVEIVQAAEAKNVDLEAIERIAARPPVGGQPVGPLIGPDRLAGARAHPAVERARLEPHRLRSPLDARIRRAPRNVLLGAGVAARLAPAPGFSF